MLYQIVNGAVQFAADTILENINFEIRDTEKIAVVGRNGCGKSTLLKLIAGEVELSKRDSDEDIFIAQAGHPTIGYLKQLSFEDDSISLEKEVRKAYQPIVDLQEEMQEALHKMENDATEQNIKEYTRLHEKFMDMDGYNYDKDLDTILHKFGFAIEDKQKPIKEFSGGQQTKIAFVKLLLSKPDIMLLDEPTNHLDISTIEWLEGYLKNYKKAVVIVSHDRMFLDKIADVVYEIEYKTAIRYPGNYSDFVARKRFNWDKQMKDHELQQKEIERLTALVERFKNKPTKVAMTRSKLKQIEHMDIIDAPARYNLKTFKSNFTPNLEGGKEVLNVDKLEVGYDTPLANVSFQIKKGQRLAIIGDNGCGKSTLLKTLVGILEPLGGTFQYGFQIEPGYFDQQIAQVASDKTVIDDFWDEFPDLLQNEVRSSLGAFLFSQEEVFKKVTMLSGGERARLSLAKILKRKPNFLILDEPTNHMDIVGKETLENMLKGYAGTVLFVSHDRYFVQQVADSLLVFENGKVNYYPCGYNEYMEINTELQNTDPPKKEYEALTSNKTTENENVKNNPGKEKSKLDKRIKKLEEMIESLENEVISLIEEMNKPENATNYVSLNEIGAEIEKRKKQIDELMVEYSNY